jgi:hypothetical protein
LSSGQQEQRKNLAHADYVFEKHEKLGFNCDKARADELNKWLKTVFIPLWRFGGSFEAHALPAFTTMLQRSKWARCGSTCYGKTPLPAASAGVV